MEARSLRMKHRKLRLLQQEVFATPPMPASEYIAYPPIFLSPSSFHDPFTPSPSPLPAVDSHHPYVPKAAIIGGSIAGIVALATTATVISTVAGELGLGCLLGPLCKRLFSCLFGKLTAPCAGKLNSLCNTLKKLNPAMKAASNKAAADGDDGVDNLDIMDLYAILGGSPNTVTKVESTAALANSLAKSPLRDSVKGLRDQLGTSAHAYLATRLSDFTELELKKQKEMMMQPVNLEITKAQGYFAQLSLTDNVSDDLRALKQSTDAHINGVSKLKAKADHMKASMEAIAAVWKQPEDAALLIFDEAVRGGPEKTKNTIAQEHAAGMKRLQKQQEPVVLEEEVVLQGVPGKPPRTSSKEAHELEEKEGEAKQQVFLGIEESASDAYTKLQLEDPAQVPHKDIENNGGAAATHRNPASTTSLALIPTYTDGNVTNSPAAGGAMVPVPTNPSVPAGQTLTSASKAATKTKRQRNLGHLSFSCEISAHRLRCFTSCTSGGTYGSPPRASQDQQNNNNNNNNNNDNNSNNYNHSITKGSDYYRSNNQPNSDNYYVPLQYNGVQIADTRSHYNLMHHRYHPSQSILVQSNASAVPALTARLAHPIEMVDNKPSAESSLEASIVHDYGSPFDGVL